MEYFEYRIKVSVIIPVYNIQDYVLKCLQSIIVQTLQEIQFIIVNDGSTDKSKEIILDYIKDDHRFLYLEKKNGGLSDARNFGLHYAVGEYVAFLDGDDYVDASMYKKMYDIAKEKDADLVHCSYYQVLANGRLRLKSMTESTRETLLCYESCAAWNKLIKNKVIENNRLQFLKSFQYEDLNFFIKLIPNLNKIACINEPLYYYVQRENSICHIYDARVSHIFTSLSDSFCYYRENNILDVYYKEIEFIYIKELLGGNFLRIAKVQDSKIRKELFTKTWSTLNNTFPFWKHNEYLRKRRFGIFLMIKCLNRTTYRFFSTVFFYFFYFRMKNHI